MALVNPYRHDMPVSEQASAQAPAQAPDAAGLYRLIAETIPHMVWTARADGRLDFFNKRCHEYTGSDTAALEGWGWKTMVHPDDWERCLTSWTRALQSGEQYEIEYRLRRSDGTFRWHHGSAVPLRDRTGRPERWFGTCTDIEAEVRSAQILESMVDERTRALRESDGRFRTFMENSPAVAWIKDSQLRYAFISTVYESTLGKPLRDMYGRDDFELWPESVAQVFRENDLDVLARRSTVQTVETAPGPDGTVQHWAVVKFPLADASGKLGVAGMGIDITPRVQAEELARTYAVDVRRLMDRLLLAQESERRRLADDLHDLIGQNLTALGIDLASLKQRLSGWLDPVDAARVDAMKALVETTIDSIRGVMTDLRPPALEEYGLEPALRWYATEFGQRTGMKACLSVAGQEARLPRATELAIFRIAQEALTNAAKHSGGTRVDIGIAEKGGNIRLTVEDDGRGFADPVGARSERRGGWGLPTMRERAEAHGGILRIEFPGRGTRLIVDIPARND